MKQKNKLPGLVTIAILTVITVIFWTGLEVFRELTVKPEPTVAAEILAPLNPNLDVDSLNKIQKRIDLNE